MFCRDEEEEKAKLIEAAHGVALAANAQLPFLPHSPDDLTLINHHLEKEKGGAGDCTYLPSVQLQYVDRHGVSAMHR